jgi:23S rRNA (adenine2503-C2)-methyltransferase
MAESLSLPTIPAPSAEADRTVRRGLLDVPQAELTTWLAAHNQPPMRAKQIRRWVLQSRATTFEQMSDLPKALRPELNAAFAVLSMTVVQHHKSIDDTHKLVVQLADGRMIECVLIQEDGRATACISTQVGCGMGCVFCASGLNGVVRNLTPGEILEQLVLLQNLTADPNQRVPFGASGVPLATRLTNVVVMGMGEPLANLDNLLAALAVAGAKDGLDIGARHITISTVGLPAKIRRLADLEKQYHLAISLHAPNDRLRTEIVPTNSKTGIEAILAASDYFFEKTGRQVTFEYVVLGQQNDQPEHAEQLVRLLRGRKAFVNLIPWNEVHGLPYKRPTESDLNGLIQHLRSNGVPVQVRKRKGADIDAACGQLRRKAEERAGGAASGVAPLADFE